LFKKNNIEKIYIYSAIRKFLYDKKYIFIAIAVPIAQPHPAEMSPPLSYGVSNSLFFEVKLN